LSELQVELVEASASRVVRFVGELDISTEGPASAEIDRAQADRPSVVGLDLSGRLEFVDDAREIAAGNGGS
jgi:anti-anti-sigma regulatory factor